MTTKLTIRKSGNSHVVTLKPMMLEQLGLKSGDSIDAEVSSEGIMLRAARYPTLQELLAEMPLAGPNTFEQIENLGDGDDVGKEIF